MAKDLLLVIDMQNVYAPGGKWHCPSICTAADRILRLLREKKGKMDVIFTQFLASEEPEGVWKDYNRENEEVNRDAFANEIMEEFRDCVSEYPMYSKSVYSSLGIPKVREAAQEASRVVVTGVVAECCVLATVLSLIDAGVPVVYLTDAVAGTDAETEAAVERILSGLEPLHVRRMTTEEYCMEV